MRGIVLCGGQSRRMGSDKGLLLHEGKFWAQIATAKLAELHIPVSISVNAGQQQAYADVLPQQQLIIDDLSLKLKGPLLGLFSAHLASPDQDIFLLACDMLMMESKLLRRLLGTVESDSGYEAYIFTRENQQEPLCGIYRSAALQKLSRKVPTDLSMKYLLRTMKVCEITVPKVEYDCFRNFNSPAELRTH